MMRRLGTFVPPFRMGSPDMAAKLTWDDDEEIAAGLFDRFPDIDPLTVRFTDLRRWVCELDGFHDAPNASTEGKLERIQMAWLEMWQSEREP